jgi:signal transduction histidine kinase
MGVRINKVRKISAISIGIALHRMATVSMLKTRPNPVRFLLYTEWLMLMSCGSLALMETLEQGRLPIQHVLILALLGLMGWVLPSGKPIEKVVYTAIEVSLIFYGTMLGYLHILPSLYLIVVIRSCFIFELPGRWAIAALSFALFLIHKIQYMQGMMPMLDRYAQHHFWMQQLSEMMLFSVSLFFILRFVSTWLSERSMREQLVNAHSQLQQYALQVEDLATVQERNRIARDIHDSLGHALTALNVQLQTVVKLWDINPNSAKSFLNQAQRLGELAIKEVRQSVRTLRVEIRQEEPLETAIASLAEDFRQSTGISVFTKIQLEGVLSQQTIKALHRIVQEALTNICKHAQASVVVVQLKTTSTQVCLSIKDNGQGFLIDGISKGYGLQGMQERVAALGGSFSIDSQPQNGCQIVVELPLETPQLSRESLIESTETEEWQRSVVVLE